jgi:hypothetical protein
MPLSHASVLSCVSCSEPQLGMMVSQFKRGTGGLGLGFAAKDGSVARFGKVGEWFDTFRETFTHSQA